MRVLLALESVQKPTPSSWQLWESYPNQKSQVLCGTNLGGLFAKFADRELSYMYVLDPPGYEFVSFPDMK